jgi:hypothetical protein
MSPTLSRKEKIEVYELKFNEFDDIIPNLEEAITQLTTELAEAKMTISEQIDHLS